MLMWGPLHLDAMNGHSEVIRVLVKEFGADVDLEDSNAMAPLHHAEKKGHHETVRVICMEISLALMFVPSMVVVLPPSTWLR